MFDYQRVTIIIHDYPLLVLIHHIISHYYIITIIPYYISHGEPQTLTIDAFPFVHLF